MNRYRALKLIQGYVDYFMEVEHYVKIVDFNASARQVELEFSATKARGWYDYWDAAKEIEDSTAHLDRAT
jgi:hypothetical protein